MSKTNTDNISLSVMHALNSIDKTEQMRENGQDGKWCDGMIRHHTKTIYEGVRTFEDAAWISMYMSEELAIALHTLIAPDIKGMKLHSPLTVLYCDISCKHNI